MPDGLTHIAVGYVGAGRWLNGGRMSLFLLGCLLPDILLRGGKILMRGASRVDFLEFYLTPLHTPMTVLVLCVGLSQMFRIGERRPAFVSLYAGCILHFVLDFFQRTISGAGFTPVIYGGYQWLYPLSWWDAQVGLFWADRTYLALWILLPWAVWRRLRKRGGRAESPPAASDP